MKDTSRQMISIVEKHSLLHSTFLLSGKTAHFKLKSSISIKMHQTDSPCRNRIANTFLQENDELSYRSCWEGWQRFSKKKTQSSFIEIGALVFEHLTWTMVQFNVLFSESRILYLNWQTHRALSFIIAIGSSLRLRRTHY